MGGAELGGLVDTVRVDVDRDDLGRSVEAGGGHDRQAHRTCADDGDDISGGDVAVLHADLKAGGQDVAEQHAVFIGDAWVQLVEGRLGEWNAYEVGLRAIDQVTEDPADTTGAFVGEAMRIESLLAELAMSAGADAGDHDPVADGQIRDRAAELGDHTHTFVTEDAAWCHGGDVALGAADRGGLDLHDGIGRLENHRIGDIGPVDLVGALIDECFHIPNIRLDGRRRQGRRA